MASVWARATHIQEPEEFDGAVEQLSKKGVPVYVLLTGAKDASGASWCPDCNQVMPSLRAALEALREGELLVMNVEKAKYRQNPEYPLRKHKGVRLTTVPTFGRWQQGRLEMRLEDNQIADKSLLNEVLGLADE